ncbi:hypothetical protein RchiOBHm_Chr2g0126931 [Rosa chinensis]|uniref:Uncharacterized protein n=1 Tax=Rosa chinensis TaxID=74649 RepID=A0A2P6RTX3_ROSCH|nr:hypothetical protein RchiOBHm_Chr2g0126931 [Rosa chinensis]
MHVHVLNGRSIVFLVLTALLHYKLLLKMYMIILISTFMLICSRRATVFLSIR